MAPQSRASACLRNYRLPTYSTTFREFICRTQRRSWRMYMPHMVCKSDFLSHSLASHSPFSRTAEICAHATNTTAARPRATRAVVKQFTLQTQMPETPQALSRRQRSPNSARLRVSWPQCPHDTSCAQEERSASQPSMVQKETS